MISKYMEKGNKKNKPKVIALLGPTASGKTKIGVRLAYKFNGEIVSADSRQVYKGMDIGTGKDLPDYKYKEKHIPYHLIDVASPRSNFNLARYQKLALKAIDDILNRGKLPIIVGGTGLYIQALIENFKLSDFKSNRKLRENLEKLGAKKLYERLIKANADFAGRINHSDMNNARRLSRYVELIEQGEYLLDRKGKSNYNFLVLGMKVDNKKMREKIVSRLHKRIDEEGMTNEVETLRHDGISYKRLISFGLEYKFVSYLLQGKINQDEMREKLATAIYRFAKKQKSWFKRFEKQGQKINWIENYQEGISLVSHFLKKK